MTAVHLQVGSIDVEVDYSWLRGTHDDGKRFRTLSLTVNRRKLKNLRSVVSHVSNVNHWMLSHDNVWAVLGEDHPALKRTSRASSGARGRPSLAHESKHHISSSASTSSHMGSTSADAVVQPGQVDPLGTSDGARSSTSDVQQPKDGINGLNSVCHKPLGLIALKRRLHDGCMDRCAAQV